MQWVLDNARAEMSIKVRSAAESLDEELLYIMNHSDLSTKPVAAVVLLRRCLAAVRRKGDPPTPLSRPDVTLEALAAVLRDAAVGLALSPNTPEPLRVGLVGV